jgi:hypothetical protein
VRKFCSRCGEELSDAAVVRLRWYRRLLRRRSPKGLAAGARPGQRGVRGSPAQAAKGVIRKVRNAFAVVIFLSGFAYAFVPPLRGPINTYVAHPFHFAESKAKDRWHALTNPYVDVPVETTSGTGATPPTSLGDAVDGNTNSFWAAPWDPAHHPRLNVVFAEPRTIAALVIHNGAPGEDASKYLQPKTLVVRYPNGLTETLKLEFTGDSQKFKLDKAKLVRRIRFEVTNVYPKAGLADVALSEIELKARK